MMGHDIAYFVFALFN